MDEFFKKIVNIESENTIEKNARKEKHSSNVNNS